MKTGVAPNSCWTLDRAAFPNRNETGRFGDSACLDAAQEGIAFGGRQRAELAQQPELVVAVPAFLDTTILHSYNYDSLDPNATASGREAESISGVSAL